MLRRVRVIVRVMTVLSNRKHGDTELVSDEEAIVRGAAIPILHVYDEHLKIFLEMGERNSDNDRDVGE